MADRRISELPVIPAVAGDDALAIVDTSLSETNKVSVEDLLRSAPAGTAAAPSIAFVDDPDTGLYRSATNEVSISTAGSQRVVVDSAGNVGIGTGSPGAKLQVENTGSDANLIINRADATTAGNLNISSGDGVNYIYSGGSKDLTIATNNQERIRINAAGNVGIGTTNPQRTFSVSSTEGVVGRLDSTGARARLGLKDVNTTTDSHVGIGSAGDNFLIYAGQAEKVRVTSSGDVGIGTSSPGVKLEVNGTIKATDINFTGLATYADDSAAGTGGLVAGDVYKTSTGELRIKL